MSQQLIDQSLQKQSIIKARFKSMKPQVKLTPEERKRLDRQRFIGLETQRKLLNSRILITPANGPNTELAKNLVLAGVNVTIYDDAIVGEDDFETNFLIGIDQIGKKRGEAVYQRIKQMNPSGDNQFFCESLDVRQLKESFLDPFTIVCTSFSDFMAVSLWDKLTKKANKPYYNIFSAGLYASCYVSLGSKYHYKELPKNEAKQFEINCLNFEQCLDKAEVAKSRRRQFEIVQATIMMKQSQEKGLSYDVFNPMKMHEQMLYCMIDLGEDIKEETNRNLLIGFAKCFGLDYCPVYSVIGSIVSQQIIKVVENQQEPAMNWIVMNSEEGYACVLKLKKQEGRITSKIAQHATQV